MGLSARRITTRMRNGEKENGMGKRDVTYPDSLWNVPEYAYEPELDFGGEDTEGVKGLFFTSPVICNGKPTKIAAYLGFPKHTHMGNKVPAIVLVHGAQGTAIPQWVKYWNDLGFAAISLDTEGGEPLKGICNEETLRYHLARNRFCGDELYEAGPSNHAFTDWELKVEDQWMYHATSAVIVATSLLSSFDCVDNERIGLTGISWGSVIASLVAGVDRRLRFAIPVYGGLSLTESHAGFQNIHPNHISAERWDSLTGLKQTSCAMYYVTSDDDTVFSLDVADRSAKAANGAVNFKKGFAHGQAQGAYEENLPNFARYCCGMEHAYIEVTQHPNRDNPVIKLRLHGRAEVASVWVCYTNDESTGPEALWRETCVSTDSETTYSFQMPDSKYAYIRICYTDKQTVCSYLF